MLKRLFSRRAVRASTSKRAAKRIAACVQETLEERRFLTAVTTVTPYNGQQSFAVASNITVTFDQAMDAATINTSTIQLRDAGNNLVPAVVTFNAATRVATLNPDSNLAATSNYFNVRVAGGATGVKDSGNGPMTNDVNSFFTTGTPTITESTVFSGLNAPSNIEFSPDGRVFVAERRGIIKVFPSLTSTTPTTVADLRTKVHNYWDRGLLGMAIDPQFTTGRPYIYVLYTYDANIGGTAPKYGAVNGDSDPGASDGSSTVSGRLSRLTITNNVMTNEMVLINDWQNQFPSHSIGDLKFGPDGNLYASAGDGASFGAVDYGQTGNPFGDPTNEGGALRALDMLTPGDSQTLDGTIIRINPDTGAAAANNPLIGNSDANAKRIIAYGLRNPFRFTFRPGTNEIWIGDVGWNAYEEINRITNVLDSKVDNFGWPAYEGNNRQSGYDAANLPLIENFYSSGVAQDAPYYAYSHSEKVVAGSSEPTGGSSPTGTAFYVPGGSLPDAYNNAFFFTDYSRKQIYVVYAGPDGNPLLSSRQVFKATTNGPVELTTGPNGDLYYVDMNGGRIQKFTGTNTNTPPTAIINADKTTGALPLTINFNGSSSFDPNPGQPLSYSWDLNGDGTFGDSTLANPSFTYTTAGQRTVSLRVTDLAGLNNTTTLGIFPGNTAPVPVINLPASSKLWFVGETLNFSGSATDAEDGTVATANLTWDVWLVHGNVIDPANSHTHPLTGFSGVSSGSFTAPTHENPSWLELRLTATDSTGLSTTVVRRIDPQTVTLTFNSNINGIQVFNNSDTLTTPATMTVIAGSENVLSAPDQTIGGVSYQFNNWSNGGAQTHTVAPLSNATYTANFTAPNTGLTMVNGFVIGTIGSYQNSGNGVEKAFDGLTGTFYDAAEITNGNGTWAGLDLGSNHKIDRLRFYPRSFWADRMEGGVFQASATANFASPVNLYTVATIPPAGAWTQVDLSVAGSYRYVRYLSPNGGWGNIAEAEFYTSTAVTTPSAPSNLVATNIDSAHVNLTWTDASNNEAFFRLERKLGGGAFELLDILPAGTTSYSDQTLSESLAYSYRVYAVNTAGTSSASNTASGTTPGNTNLLKLSGGVIGTAGSYGGGSSTRDKALDGRTDTFFDAPESSNGNGTWVGLDLGTAKQITQLKYFPRTNWSARMIDGKFQASNDPAFASGVVDLFTIGARPTEGVFTTKYINNASTFRYVRYLSPNGGWGNVAEVEFYTSSSIVPGNGLTGSYYNSTNFSGTPITRIDPTIDLNWGLNGPASGIGVDDFTARWTGKIRPEFSQAYTFHLFSDNGVRLWVNDTLIIDQWLDQSPREYTSTPITLTADQKYDIKLEYFERNGGAEVQMFWSSGNTPKQIVPQANLYSA